MIATKISLTSGLPTLDADRGGLLVRIYPLNGLHQPLELTKQAYLVGRDEQADIFLDDEAVSRRHASIERVGNQYLIQDLQSTNGTYLNEHLVEQGLLQSGDRVRFGKQIFKFVASDAIESHYHELMFNLATSDGLTQVPNKRFFIEILQREMEAMYRRKEQLSVLLMDLDKFKSVNDTFGHLAGDAVLVEFAKRAKQVLRSGELIARFGGEEFAVLCSSAGILEAEVVAERIRLVMAESPVRFGDAVIHVTVSIGIASTGYEQDCRREQLLEEADKWLYQAKEQGRNQVQHAMKNV